MSNYSLLKVLMERDKMTKDEALELIEEAREEVANGGDPEEILQQDFGLEPDYVWELL